ncbi:MAG TPA: GNAT family N-acyltransferase [Nocardia sp.]|uniref:GNAT family N-acetyltransferase n=1 Tax=Nocardia sp. TaxID=1821 RepID=UPI002B4B1177|nr:GNAT family N-acyltransferase [Nocardia sp.]HLS79689.1 GNAT family N-acyltransferase [Nocardia sp.]
MTSMSVLTAPAGSAGSGVPPARYALVVASDAAHREAAQRLRHAVFAAEPGFRAPDDGTGRDADRFDQYCDHLLVRDRRSGEFVGCYRMLPPDKAAAAGGYYTATEFDLTDLDPHGRRIVEMGRACVAPGHRNGSVLTLMWAGILHYIQLTGYDRVMGCVSVPMAARPGEPEGHTVRGVRDLVTARHLTAPGLRVRPLRPVVVDGRSLDELPAPARVTLPPLLRGYLRLGARICGEPAHDPDFGVADFVALLGLDSLDTRYLERLRGAANAVYAGRSESDAGRSESDAGR